MNWIQKEKQTEASQQALKELVQSGQKIGLLRNALEQMCRKYPQWAEEIKQVSSHFGKSYSKAIHFTKLNLNQILNTFFFEKCSEIFRIFIRFNKSGTHPETSSRGV